MPSTYMRPQLRRFFLEEEGRKEAMTCRVEVTRGLGVTIGVKPKLKPGTTIRTDFSNFFLAPPCHNGLSPSLVGSKILLALNFEHWPCLHIHNFVKEDIKLKAKTPI